MGSLGWLKVYSQRSQVQSGRYKGVKVDGIGLTALFDQRPSTLDLTQSKDSFKELTWTLWKSSFNSLNISDENFQDRPL